ncbi:hypothetical protein [Burkholderia pseudomultivorans]|uniref:Uncharacterized protein n=1 Tax=Burkholderia pseudomultivorans TaxID=1207504 RepID=A0ABU2ED33_9BURK|nr:hypothetical protein [Burkholderia pseudomultivorans]MDR8731334.1 hypothetical protein [Burkholderia pseudomultivorans]MDR8738955.1 hypothetical protein [Burkholderia pseudomultivorans]MDR8745506.1 hypothetical protein [Burkholderia pseudomultivorans]MDR8757792.1 hypothetical protein [Burkholderia pseudomultivorans]MDR8781892.1 hypothetical protein [Burkholderia pseudomultivorans]
MLDFSDTFRDDRFDTLMPTSPTPRAIRRMNESRRASLRARKNTVLAELARNLVRNQSEPATEADAPSVHSALAAWDAHVADARAHFAAQDEAYRLARLVPEHHDQAGTSPVWQAMLDDLNNLNTPIEA